MNVKQCKKIIEKYFIVCKLFQKENNVKNSTLCRVGKLIVFLNDVELSQTISNFIVHLDRTIAIKYKMINENTFINIQNGTITPQINYTNLDSFQQSVQLPC